MLKLAFKENLVIIFILFLMYDIINDHASICCRIASLLSKELNSIFPKSIILLVNLLSDTFRLLDFITTDQFLKEGNGAKLKANDFFKTNS